MSKRLDETLGTVGYDNLINGLYPPAEPFSVVIRKGSAETTYKRGTVLALSEVFLPCSSPGSMAVFPLVSVPVASGHVPMIQSC